MLNQKQDVAAPTPVLATNKPKGKNFTVIEDNY